MKSNSLESQAAKSDDRLGRTNLRPIAKSRVLFASLLRRWESSVLKIVIGECYRFPLRILAVLRTPELALGPKVPLTLWDHSPVRLYPPSSFLLACSDHIQHLKNAAPWAGSLEAQLLARAFQLGAQWAVSNDSEKHNASVP
jgi:hypothetical protein